MGAPTTLCPPPALFSQLQWVLQAAGAPQYVGISRVVVALTAHLQPPKSIWVVHISLTLPLWKAREGVTTSDHDEIILNLLSVSQSVTAPGIRYWLPLGRHHHCIWESMCFHINSPQTRKTFSSTFYKHLHVSTGMASTGMAVFQLLLLQIIRSGIYQVIILSASEVKWSERSLFYSP